MLFRFLSPLAVCFAPATRAFWRANRESGASVPAALHGYIYARWPRLYIGMLMGRLPLARPFVRLEKLLRRLGLVTDAHYAAFAQGYHAKVLQPGAAPGLLKIERPIAMYLPEKVLPYSRARQLILEVGERLAVIECPCRASRNSSCGPRDVCIIVGNTVADFVLAAHKDKARSLTPEEAIRIVERENRRGRVSHAFFKDAVLDRFFCICNCCSCCCAAIESHKNGTPTLVSSGFVADLDALRCEKCGLCARRCPFDAVSTLPGGPVVDEARCMGCGICSLICPAKAMRLDIAPQRPAPLPLASNVAGECRVKRH